MGMSIKHNISSLNSLRHSSDNFDKVKSSIEKLSSGQKINRASDGPSTLIASERLRGQIVGMRQALSNAESSVSLVQTAEGGLGEVNALLLNLRQLSVHAANEAVNDKVMLEADQSEIEHLLESIDRISSNTVFGSRRLLDGSNGANGVAVGKDLLYVSATPRTGPSPESGYPVDITQVATQTQARGTVPLNTNNIGDGVFLVITEGGKSAVLDTSKGEVKTAIDKIVANTQKSPETFPPEKSAADIRTIVLTQLNKKITDAGLDVNVELDSTGVMTVKHRQFGSQPQLSVSSSIPGVLSQQADIAQFATPGKDVEGTIGGEIALGRGQFLTGAEGTKAEGLTIQYTREIGVKEVPKLDENGKQVGVDVVNETNEDIVGTPSQPKNEGYVHLSQRSVTFQVGPYEGQEARLSMANIRTNQLSRGIVNKSGFDSLADVDVRTTQGAKDAMNLIDRAIDEVSRSRGELGSFQKNALESNLSSLKVAEENLTGAESTIRDADMAKEMSALTSGQIMLSSSTAMLAQANQVPNAVLGLITNGGK